MSAPPADYYATLEIDSKATQQQIRDAYKKAALRHHPDRVPADSPERQTRTKKFQQINDAYYTLSDATRRRDYDTTRTNFYGFGGGASNSRQSRQNAQDHQNPPGGFGFDEEDIPRPEEGADGGSSGGGAAGGFFNMFGNMFGGQAKTEGDANRFSNEQFGSVFEEMMRDNDMADSENRPTKTFWSIVGGMSGGAMGFIMGNFPGAIAGAVAGNRLGAVRDKRGKSVYSVFQELDQPEKMRLLGELAQKVFAHAIS